MKVSGHLVLASYSKRVYEFDNPYEAWKFAGYWDGVKIASMTKNKTVL